ncbi:helix-turn-helix domain-containing protein [Aminobacter sp. UC22_36]|uniref:helix-turn-helix domain-containing protein n=1 Tax=Aminobacter sp. UC22_36 TaxID=3374549 RepID=UPI003757B733
MYVEHQNVMYRPEFVRAVNERRRQIAEARKQGPAEPALSAEEQRALDWPNAVAAARKIEAGWLESGQRIPVKEIIRHFAKLHGVHPSDITMKGMKRNEVLAARIEAILLINKLRPEFSSTKLGHIFNRDHSSILHILSKYGGVQKSGQRPTVEAG